MENPASKQDSCFKNIQIESNKKNNILKIQVAENLIEIVIFVDNRSVYKGNISKENISNQIIIFTKYNIDEIFEEISFLESNCFNIVKEHEKYKLKIKFKILRKDEFLVIDLEENKNINLQNNDLINYYDNIIKQKDDIIFELNQIIRKKDEKIKELKTQLMNYNIESYNKKAEETNIDNIQKKNDNLYNDFNIKLKNPIHKLNAHTACVYCLSTMNDGRLVSGSSDKSIIIYNKETYQPDLIIKEHSGGVYCIIQLSSGILASCSSDKSIKLFNIKEKEYEVIQTLNYHTSSVFRLIALKNKTLASCSGDSSIIFFLKENLEYKKDYKLSTNGSCSSIIQTKDNEICYSENNNNSICFFDLLERKVKATISNISKISGPREWIIMMTKDLLLIPGDNKLSIINVNYYKLVRIIDVPGASWICGVCLLNQNMLLTGDYGEIIRQWRIEGDNLILVSKKEKTHDNDINVLLNLGDGHIASGSDDNSIKIW